MAGLILVVLVFSVAWVTGARIERAHLASLARREAAPGLQPIVTLRQPADPRAGRVVLVTGATVIAIDAFRQWVGSLVSLVGGRLGVFDRILDRALREAALRLREQARDAREIVNLRFETTRLGPGAYEVFAYATALYDDA